MFRKISVALALLAGSIIAAQRSCAGDAKAGAEVFKRCAVCHTSEKGGGDGLGPNLSGVFGRKAATRPGFAYSAALKKTGLVWNEANLTKWVAGPQRVVAGHQDDLRRPFQQKAAGGRGRLSGDPEVVLCGGMTRIRLTSLAALQQKQAGIVRAFVDRPRAPAIVFAPHKKDGNAHADNQPPQSGLAKHHEGSGARQAGD